MSPTPTPAATAAELHEAETQEPVLELDGLRFRGRILSIEQWLPHWEQRCALEEITAEALANKQPPPLRPWVNHWVAFLKDVFPSTLRNFWSPDPIHLIRRLPGNGLREHYEHFFSHQALALGMRVAVESPTDGTSSSGSTPASPGDAAGG